MNRLWQHHVGRGIVGPCILFRARSGDWRGLSHLFQDGKIPFPQDFDLEDGIHQTPPSQKVAEWSELMTSYLKTNEDGRRIFWEPTELIFDTENFY